MTLTTLLVTVAAVTVMAILIGAVGIVGLDRLRATVRDRRARVRTRGPYVLLLAAVLVINSKFRTVARELSWQFGVELTATIYAIEGDLVPWIQGFATAPITAVLSFQYVYGYICLLVFPLIAYFALADREPFRTACLAYAFNYAIGLMLYVFVVAYGPRNLLLSVESLLYTAWPESQLLTTQLNVNTNVFPSLHASLSTTVVLLAYRTRTTYPAWFALSVVMAVTIVIATLYLGIHWALDAVAGVALALVSVVAATRYDPVRWLSERTEIDSACRAVARVRNALS